MATVSDHASDLASPARPDRAPDGPRRGQPERLNVTFRIIATVFADPDRFDPRRTPTPHLGSGHGIHHCPGASLARLELHVILDELAARVGRLELAGRAELTRSNKHNGIRRLPVRLHRE